MIKTLLLEQIPPTMAKIHLRHMTYDQQTKIILEKLVQLKIEGVLRALKTVRLHFFAPVSQLEHLVIGAMMGMMSLSAIARGATSVKTELGKLFEGASIALQVYQSKPDL